MINVGNISNQIAIPTAEAVPYNFDFNNQTNSNNSLQNKKIKENKEDTYTPNSVENSEDSDYTKKLKNQTNNASSKRETSGKEEEENEVSTEEKAVDGEKLSDEEKKVVEELKEIDKKVRAHEQAHKTAGGGLVRGSSFNEKTGPDGKKYATGGEVQIDISEVPDNPQATITKMQQVVRAALAPADPSAQDRMVAAKASAIAAESRAELYSKKSEESTNNFSKNNTPLTAYKNTDNNYENKIGKILDVSINDDTTGSLKRLFAKQ